MRFVRIALVCALVVGSVAAIIASTLPADVAYRFLGDRLAPLRLHDISGTLWRGHARSVDLGGYDLGSVDWTLQFAPLLRGAAILQLAVRGIAGGSGTIERAADGEIRLQDARITMPASVAAPVFAIPALAFAGTIDINLTQARIFGMWLTDAHGVATWRDAAASGAAQAQLGNLQATFASAADGAIAGVITDLGGPLEVAGTFKATLGRYDAQVRLASRGDNAQLTEALQFIGQPQADGSRLLLIEGRQLGNF
jgi:general secretion pathway protein N